MKIKNTKTSEDKRITILVYGQSGIGKTTLAKTLPGKTLIINAESGLLSLAGNDIDYVDIEGENASQKMNSLSGIMQHLKKEVVYDNIFVDSLTEISQIMVDYSFDKIGNNKSKAIVAWGDYAKQIKRFIKAMRDMKPYNIILTSLDKTIQDEYQKRFICPDLSGSIAQQCPQYFDEVFYMTTVKDDNNSKRVIVTSAFDGGIAKDRSTKLQSTESPDLGIIFDKIKNVGEKKTQSSGGKKADDAIKALAFGEIRRIANRAKVKQEDVLAELGYKSWEDWVSFDFNDYEKLLVHLKDKDLGQFKEFTPDKKD